MPAPSPTRIELAPSAARAAAAALVALSRGSLPLLLVLAALATDPPLELPNLLDLLLTFALLPALGAFAIGRALRGEALLAGGDLVLRRRALRVEVPLASVSGIEPWRVPLPRPGFALRLRSGARLRWSLAAADPSALLRELAAAGVPGAQDALAHPALVYAAARAAAPRRFWQRPLVALVLFALVPAGVGFYAHQHIAYGGLLGEYYLMGLAAYLRTAALYWLHSGVLLLLYGSAFRAFVEAASLAAARFAPARAAALRRRTEGGAAALYYASVPTLLAIRFLGS
jgi:apolipoprotein N-acyltransferase